MMNTTEMLARRRKRFRAIGLGVAVLAVAVLVVGAWMFVTGDSSIRRSGIALWIVAVGLGCAAYGLIGQRANSQRATGRVLGGRRMKR
jgi:Na+/proline symporter